MVVDAEDRRMAVFWAMSRLKAYYCLGLSCFAVEVVAVVVVVEPLNLLVVACSIYEVK